MEAEFTLKSLAVVLLVGMAFKESGFASISLTGLALLVHFGYK